MHAHGHTQARAGGVAVCKAFWGKPCSLATHALCGYHPGRLSRRRQATAGTRSAFAPRVPACAVGLCFRAGRPCGSCRSAGFFSPCGVPLAVELPTRRGATFVCAEITSPSMTHYGVCRAACKDRGEVLPLCAHGRKPALHDPHEKMRPKKICNYRLKPIITFFGFIFS